MSKSCQGNQFRIGLLIVCVIFITSGILFGSGDSLWAKTKPEANLKREILVTEVEDSYRSGNMRVSEFDHKPLALYNVNYPVMPDIPERMALQYLEDHAELLKLKKDLSDLRHRVTIETPGSYHVRFDQFLGGYQVYKAEIVVTINRKDVVTFVVNDYKPHATLPKMDRFALPAKQALTTAKQYLQIEGKIRFQSQDMVIYNNRYVNRLAQRITIVPSEKPIGDWEILMDVANGEIFRVEDKSVYASGTGNVFDPDPISSSGATYGTGGYTDDNDADSSDLTNALTAVTLLDITLNGTYYLTGPYAQIVDSEAPYNGVFNQASSDFSCQRAADLFEAVNAYYHIDKSMRYIQVDLGFPYGPYQYSGGVRVDPHGLNGDDNSHYSSATGEIAWGEGGVDDAEDLSVILHELGHAVHDFGTNGGLSQVNGLSEGIGDYWVASYLRSWGSWAPTDPEYQWIFLWDGHNPFWSGRDTNSSLHYPDQLTGNIYTDGAIWSTVLMQIWNDIGRPACDSNLMEALASLGSSSNQQDAANAFIQADMDLHAGANLTAICNWFGLRGYDPAGTGCACASPPAPPTNLGAAVNSGNVDLTWTAGAGATSYSVFRASGTCPQASYQNIDKDITGTSYSDTTANPGGTYAYVVISVDDVNPGCESGNSNCAEATIPICSGNETILFDDDMESGSANWSALVGPNDQGGTAPWAQTTSSSNSPTHSWFCSDEASVKDQLLVTASAINIPASGSVFLSFFHEYDTETGYDGGVLEYSVDGVNWYDILASDGTRIPANPDRFIMNGYNDTLATGFENPLPGRDAWSGASMGYLKTMVNLSDFAGSSVYFRWRMGCDSSVSDVGWAVDDVQVMSCSDAPVPTISLGAILFLLLSLTVLFSIHRSKRSKTIVVTKT
ncbi:hypothetical protein ACFL27_16830 [candidate division CSSED10-310 bacterium]|uniref:Fibronectin type-III domain-containing protein n=1 Tax=candidate division CSSED10-310 bacterium TaxID=2855610 RepID=A0ABV6Z092_UNCC1